VRALGDGEVDSDPSAVNLSVAHGVLGSFGVFHRLEIHEGKPSGPASLSIKNHLNFLQGAKLGELLFQLSLSGVQAQAENTQARGLIRRVPGSDVASPV